ncbi:MAG: hypothetical protein WD800_02335 [Dehalococcoidia bacterium]
MPRRTLRRLTLVGGLFVVACCLAACSGGPPSTAAPPGDGDGASVESPPPSETHDDPFAYCGAVRTIDAPDGRYTGDAAPAVLIERAADAQGIPPDSEQREGVTSVSWRCVDGRVLVCTVAPNLPCGRADTSEEPNVVMTQFCLGAPDGQPIPGQLTGHNWIHGWWCQDAEPVIAARIYDVDARGFVSGFWYEVRRA